MAQTVKLTKLAECAGCGAKVGAGALAKLLEGLDVRHDPRLLVGFDKSDDAAVYQVSDHLAIVETLDFFPPIADDPYTYGAIAAANALSDVWAMGGEPKVALNIMAVPEDMPKDVVHQILRGGYEKVYEAGASIVGGHSIYDEEPKYGLSVTGFVDPAKLWTNAGAKEGDVLVYTKPLGIGVTVTSAKGGLATSEQLEYAEQAMMRLNRWPHDVALEGGFAVDAATDITGFGVLGHLLEMVQGAGLACELKAGAFQLLPGALEAARLGLLPAGTYRNRHFAADYVDGGDTELALLDLLFTPETSGGLLFAVPAHEAGAFVTALNAADKVLAACAVGRMVAPRDAQKLIFVR